MANPSPFRIMVFSWNTDGLRICNTLDQKRADEERKGVKAFFTRPPPCVAPSFFTPMYTLIQNNNPDLIAISTLDEPLTGTELHSKFLQERLPELGYDKLKRDKLDNVGSAASGLPTGREGVKNGGIRLSIYARRDIIGQLRASEAELDRFIGNDGQSELICRSSSNTRVAGAIASYVQHPVFGKFVFICVHLPDSSELLAIKQGRLDHGTYRESVKAANKLCLINMMSRFVNDIDIVHRPDHVILFGDFNYEIIPPGKTPLAVATDISNRLDAASLRTLQQYDEMTQAKKEPPLVGFNEGRANEGPVFLPTYKLTRGRPPQCSPDEKATKLSVGVEQCFDISGNSYPAWRHRILYKELGSSQYTLHCTYYMRQDVEVMRQSHNAGMLAIFDLVGTSK